MIPYPVFQLHCVTDSVRQAEVVFSMTNSLTLLALTSTNSIDPISAGCGCRLLVYTGCCSVTNVSTVYSRQVNRTDLVLVQVVGRLGPFL